MPHAFGLRPAPGLLSLPKSTHESILSADTRTPVVMHCSGPLAHRGRHWRGLKGWGGVAVMLLASCQTR
jgi:hypothetical protein